MENEVIEMESWNPELGYFPKKEILGKIHQTTIDRGYAERDGKRLKYILNTYDDKFGNRQLQITATQARILKDCSVPFKLFIRTEPTIVNGKDCFSAKISRDSKEWY